MATTAKTSTSAPPRDLAAEVAFLTRALKAPTLRESVPRLADRARTEGWSHEEFLVACLQREVAARESHGGEGRIRAARLPARESFEEFDFDHARSLTRNVIAHLGALDLSWHLLDARLCAILRGSRRCAACFFDLTGTTIRSR